MKSNLLEAKESALRSYKSFLYYFSKELEIIENLDYNNSEKFLSQFPERVKEQIFGANRNKNYYSQIEEFTQDIKDESLVARALYLSRVVDYLKGKSKDAKYAPAQGSFWEGIGEKLEEIALEVQEKL